MSKKDFFPILKILIFRVKNGQKTPKYQDKAGSGPLQPHVSACLLITQNKYLNITRLSRMNKRKL